MIELRVLKDNFMVGTRKCTKGEIIKVNAGAVAYAMREGNCELVLDETVKAKTKKKPVYKTRVAKPESD